MHKPKNPAEIYELLLNYESRHDTDQGTVSGSLEQRGNEYLSE